MGAGADRVAGGRRAGDRGAFLRSIQLTPVPGAPTVVVRVPLLFTE